MLFPNFKARTWGLGEESARDTGPQGTELDGLTSLKNYERLTHFVRGSTRHAIDGQITVLDFRPLFAVATYHCQRELAREVSHALTDVVTEAWMERLQLLTQRYGMSFLSSPPGPTSMSMP